MPLHRTGIAIVAGVVGSIAVTAIGVSAPRSSIPAGSLPATNVTLTASAHSPLPAPANRPKIRSAPRIESAALSDVVKNFCTGCQGAGVDVRECRAWDDEREQSVGDGALIG